MEGDGLEICWAMPVQGSNPAVDAFHFFRSRVWFITFGFRFRVSPFLARLNAEVVDPLGQRLESLRPDWG